MSVRLLLWKDLRREWRSREGLQAGLVLVGLFFVLDIFVFPSLDGQVRAATALLWVPLLYGTAAVAGRGMAAEHDRGTLEWLQSAPVPRLHIGLARTLADGMIVALLGAVTLLLADLLFGIGPSQALWLVWLLAIPGLTVVGSLAGALAAQAQARELLLPILMVPVLTPLLLAGVQATLAVLAGASVAEARPALLLLVGYDLVATGLAWLLWPVVLEGDG